ncbi:protein kinase [Micromonospora phytophila]|nr:protein kinase [Micromonospora phytophila]MCM0675127.1 protein kinase [Micromonospora phytophila]
MGRVWLARDEMLHRDVAVKEVVPPVWLAESERDELRRRTLREARTAARLTHPNVVRVYDVVHDRDSPWIVMEYVPSRSVQQIVGTDGPLSPRRTARIGLAVLAALRAAHAAGVLHRDVKPHNVLVADDGRVVLTDFGLATFDGGDGAMTGPGMVLGSPQFVAPERARDGISDPRTDLWSLGATLYAAVEGHSPYARASAMATLSALATEPPDPMRRAGPLRRPGDPPPTELITAYVAGVAATLRGDHERAGPALRRAVVLGSRLTGPALTPTALTWAATAGLLVAVDSAAHRLAERAIELARTRGELSVLSRALELRAITEYWPGRHEAAGESSREGLRVARATGQSNCAAVHLGMLAVLAAVRADRDTSLRRIREMGEGPQPGSRPHALARWALGVLDLVDGRHADAAARLTSLACPGTGRGQVLVQVMATPYLVEAAAQLTHRPAATTALGVFDRWAGSTANPSRRALSARCHALLAPRGSAEAEEAFRAALRLHPVDAGTFERARTELLFGQELRRSRRPRDARAHLHHARETFTLLGASAWAEQATAELRAAGESVGPADLPAARLLTGQQLRIAHLVAEGATNREIAARMFLSTRTVDHHLRNIFHRLNIRSRTQLARALS